MKKPKKGTNKILEAQAVEPPTMMAFNAVVPRFLTASADSLPAFSMIAYTGGRMNVAGFSEPVVVDMSGLDISAQSIPIRLDHKPAQGVGHTTKIEVVNGELVAEGVISRGTTFARDVATSGRNGFPWQASIGGPIVEQEFVPAGAKVQVNGREFEGPLNVIRKMTLKEISFVDHGADGNTRAVVQGQEPIPEPAPAKAPDPLPLPTPVLPPTPVVTAQSAPTPVVSLPIVPVAPVPAAPVAPSVAASAPPAPQPQAASSNTVMTLPTPQPTTLSAQSTSQFPDEASEIARMRENMRKAVVAETSRIQAIREMGQGKFPDLEAKAIGDGWHLEQFELEFLRLNSRAQVAPVVRTNTENTLTPQIFEAIGMMTSGSSIAFLESQYDERTLDAAHKYRHIKLQEFVELVCGQRLPSFRSSAGDWLHAAFSSASLPGILSNIANKSLLEGYNYVDDSWRQICKVSSVSDFKEHVRFRMNGNFTFQKVGADGELKHGALDEQRFGQKADTHGIMFSITRQMIIDDDMGAISETPRQIGMGAGEALADAVWSCWLSNPTQRDGKRFFCDEHKNYLEGPNTVLDVQGLTAAEIKFGEQTKPNGRPLGAMPSILLVPPSLKVTAELLMKSLLLNETTPTNKPALASNPHVGKFKMVCAPYLANQVMKGHSSKAWYLLADPNRLSSIEVAFLGGVDRPTVERADADFNVLGIQYRGYIDFGVREQDWRGALKMKGEA